MDRETVKRYAPPAKPATNPTAGFLPGPPSRCEPHREVIMAALERGLTAQRIHQDICAEHGFRGSYESVKRFVRRMGATLPLPFRRIECAPGEEMQVDFGQGAWIEADGKRRRPHLFRAVLSHSRKGYSEVVWRQDTESFIRCCENAFRHFGGVMCTAVGPTSSKKDKSRMSYQRAPRFAAVNTFAQKSSRQFANICAFRGLLKGGFTLTGTPLVSIP